MTARLRRHRQLLRRPALLFGLLLVGPALGFALLGWRGVQQERALLEREAAGDAREVLDRRLEGLAQDLEVLRVREDQRPYFAYQTEYVPEEMVFQTLGFQPSPLTKAPEDPRVLGWFQWERGQQGVFEAPEVFGPGAEGWRDGLVAGYGEALRARLDAAPRSVEVRVGREVRYPLRVVAANEERGQLYEEIQVLQGQTEGEDPATPRAVEVTPYLESFYRRVNDEPVPVRYGPLRWLARPAGTAGPPLVAWRLVWVPNVLEDRREIDRDRWLLQGFAVDIARGPPEPGPGTGATRVLRRDRAMAAGVSALEGRSASLVEALHAEVLGPPGTRADPSLALQAIVDPGPLAAAYDASRARFLWLVASLAIVVAAGVYLLFRGVRRELALVRRKEDFVAAVTHELKTPLAGIRMYADMLREGWVRDDESAERYAGRIVEESERLGHLVDQVLDLAALERGVAALHAAPGDLGEAVRQAVRLLERRAEQAGVAVEVAVGEDLPEVPFDPRLLRPLVLNLVDNAIKYSAGAPERAVRVEVRRDGDRAAALVVSDRGVGIPASVRRHLFEPFHRAGDEMTRTTSGVGIGLALVKRYADAHGARVTVDSEPGRGTTVTVRFPHVASG